MPRTETSSTASAKSRRAVAISASRDGERRRHPDRWTCRTRGPAGRAGSRPTGPPPRASAVSNSTPIIRPATANVEDEPVVAVDERSEPGERLLAARRGVVDEAALEELDRRERRGAGDRVAAVRRTVGAGAPRLEDLGAGDQGARAACPTRCPWRSAGCPARRPSARSPTSCRSVRRPTGSRRRSAGCRAGRRSSRRPRRKPSSGTM